MIVSATKSALEKYVDTIGGSHTLGIIGVLLINLSIQRLSYTETKIWYILNILEFSGFNVILHMNIF